jgi:hypothetical protein
MLVSRWTINILYREGVRPLLIIIVGCTMNGGRWLPGLRPQRTAAPPPLLIAVVLVRATVAQIPWDWSLRHRNNEVRPFLLTLCVGSLNRDRATSGVSLLCSWSTASSPGEAPVLSSLPTVVEVTREAFPRLGWARVWQNGAINVEVRRLGIGLCGKNFKATGHYLWSFLHRIVAEKMF